MASTSNESDTKSPLLETKRFIPKWRRGLVSRPRLVERLERGRERHLTLISAPAGFGKSTLLAEWLATNENGGKVAWVSLDAGDNDPALFWAYVVTSLHETGAGLGDAALASLRSPQPPPIETILTALINDVVREAGSFVLVLDDYHVIEHEAIHRGLAFLLDHLPEHLHLVIASRLDPPLPLARLRSRGELTELRASDLRFTDAEAATFLQEVMGLDLSATAIAALESRTEGWIAGLQLAALSMQDRSDIEGFAEAFAGDSRYIVDFLVEEVLQRQQPEVRDFLLRTSVLERLSGPLCDAVTGRSDGRAMLEHLERSNLFLVPLDDRRQWYRFHHLFADVLGVHLQYERPDEAPELHRRASEWLADHGFLSDAIGHAVAAGDNVLASDLIERAEPGMRQNRQEATLLGWYRSIPETQIRSRPALCVGFAFALLSNGELERVSGLLEDAERLLAISSEPAIQADYLAAPRSLAGEIAIARAGMAMAIGDIGASAGFARRALQLVSPEDHFWRGAASALLGLVAWSDGELDEAYRLYGDGMSFLRRAGYISDAIGGSSSLAEIRVTQGRLQAALEIYERGLQLAVEHGAPEMRGTADMHAGMSWIFLERGDLEAARRSLQRSRDQGEHTGFPRHPWRWRAVQAGILQAEGDHEGAMALLGEAERLYISDYNPAVRPIPAIRARYWLQQGRLADALGWVQRRGVAATDGLSFLAEYDHVTLAKVLVAQYRADRRTSAIREAMHLLERLLDAVAAGGRAGSALEVLITQATGYAAQDDQTRALSALERALTLAEPEGHVRPFTDEGEVMRALLQQAVARGVAPAYAARLFTAFGTPTVAADVPASMPEPLTGREVEILRLIATGMRNEQIADQLFISRATVKRHIANAYGKLSATNRVEAISRAREIGAL